MNVRNPDLIGTALSQVQPDGIAKRASYPQQVQPQFDASERRITSANLLPDEAAQIADVNREQIERVKEEVLRKISEREDILELVKELNRHLRTLDENYTVRYDPNSDRNYVEVLDMKGNQIKTIPPMELLRIVARARRVLMAGGSLREASGVFLDVFR
jgi:uncharacterized FlaG/YvyC family protein